MMFRTHLVFGLFLSVVLFISLHLNHSVLFLGSLIVASAFPDLDTGKSTISKKLWSVSWIFRIFKHRGIFHSLFIALFLSGLLYFVHLELALGFFLGYLSHILLDSLTLEGIQLLYPLPWKLRGFLKTNGIIENIFFVCLLILALYLVVTSVYVITIFRDFSFNGL